MKRWFVDPLIIILIVGALVFFFKLTGSLFQQDLTPILEKAYTSYQAGEKAADVEQRQLAFNQALESYALLEDQFHPMMGNGKLYYNIANTFYQLEAYPWAILNAYRAMALRPRDEKVQANLKQSLEKLSLPPPQITAFSSVFFFHTFLSLPERIQIFSVLSIACFLCLSLYIWLNHRFWRILATFLGVMTAVMTLSLGYSYYVAPIESVLIRSSLLYRDAGTQYAPVSENPTPSGLKVRVLDTADYGKWLKVQSTDGTVGFIPADAMRLI